MQARLLLSLWLLVSLGSCSGATDYFSSITGLEQLLQTEQILMRDLSTHLSKSKARLQQLESELSAIELEHELAGKGMENYLTNPVNVYRLMKRLRTDWTELEARVQQMSSRMPFSIAQHHHTLSFPSQEDVDGAALALVRLQSTYKLDVAQVAAGILNGIKYGTAMSWQDCFVLGQQLFEMEDYNNTKVWLRESMERLRQRQPHHILPEAGTLNSMELVAKTLFQMGDFDTAYELSQRVLEFDPKRIRNWHLGDKAAQPTPTRVDEDDDWAENVWGGHLPKHSDPYSLTEEFAHYEKVCRGEVGPSAAQERPLRCRYARGHNTFRLLAPFKIEEHSLDPYVVTYHDMLSVEKIVELKQMAVPRMQRSTVNPLPGGQLKKSAFRVSKNAWLAYNTHPTMLGMLQDLHDASGLDMTYCEQLQVANYGVGGHYEPHWDFFRDESHYPAEEGNRIATAIFYLSDVEQGGATAFPFLNFAVKPQLGNVLFWYNLHRSSDMDYRTKHAGCPVLKGSKWIGNVWIHEATQTFARPCDVYRDHEISLDYEAIK
ncbi:prolyl 4-hydroxylase subunit alpha-1-like [Scaptodrosophila lebanonensis]|uniref:procollagen-proline 4-dioxygenase n=1 Tax=Drosophila lebanonensis TaxID=7225 RepID=A0A6J2SXG7_DROLE|nr:prolyl 4-hydroxylase subunit alpha-1-like [Scaptodrosophila lebanonensis]